MTERVTIKITNGVADVRLNRPEKRNALDGPMFNALIDAGKRLAVDKTLRAVVLSGEGLGFCAGLDFKSFLGGSGGDLLSRDADSLANRAQRAAFVWQEVPVPVIAAIHGVAFGGGLQIALGADIRYATADAQLSIMAGRLLSNHALPLAFVARARHNCVTVHCRIIERGQGQPGEIILGGKTIERACDWNCSFVQRTDCLQDPPARFFFADHAKPNQLAIDNWQLR